MKAASCLVVIMSLLPLVRPANVSAAEAVKKTVIMTIDYGDGVEKRFTAIPWRDKMTVLDALEYAQKHRRGIKARIRGRGKTAFLTGIDDLQNQGSRGGNWIYRVNDKLATHSFAIHELNPKDEVLWRFGEYR